MTDRVEHSEERVSSGGASRGAVTGLMVGLLGGAIFLGAMYLPRVGVPEFLFLYPRWARGVRSQDYLLVTTVGLVFSILLSATIEKAAIDRETRASRWRAGFLAGGIYLVVLAVLGCLAWFAPRNVVGSPPNLFGLDMFSPYALLTWAIVAGGLHALRRPTQQG